EYGDAQDTYEQYNLVDTDTAIVAYGGDEPVGCGCFKPYDGDSVELKRMYVDDARRGSGLGRTLLLALETWARELGYRAMVLETGTRQHAAVALYERAGYTRIPLYPPYVGMALSICMRKLLT
ncbi:MAG TPA: GNAT family N-acetyltransferase, partial [Kofleriaceae bacterium]|nr:GNAT family N-acetyltransferase [Kofleriaceae bacterium]